jgi:hypothetical protein
VRSKRRPRKNLGTSVTPRVQTIAPCETLGLGPLSPTGPLQVTGTLAHAVSPGLERQVGERIVKIVIHITSVEENTSDAEEAPSNEVAESIKGYTVWQTTPHCRYIENQALIFGNSAH